MAGIRVTAEDLDTGQSQTVELQPGQYVVICAEPKYLEHEQHYANGTTVLTLKRHAGGNGG